MTTDGGQVILDTDVLVDLIRGLPAATAWARSASPRLLVSGIAALEIAFGAPDRPTLRRVETLLASLTIIWPRESDVAGALALAGPNLANRMGVLDALTANLAIASGLPLVTFNTRHFAAIPDLVTVQPYARP